MPEEQAAARQPVPRLLCDVRALIEQAAGAQEGSADEAAASAGTAAGAVWKLGEPDRQLDANVVRLPAGRSVGWHSEPDLDVLLLVLTGSGTVETLDGAQPVAEGSLLWLPHGSSRGLEAGPEGLVYLTTHRRRPGMSIRNAGGLGPRR